MVLNTILLILFWAIMEDESTSQIITAPSTSFQMDGILLDSKTIMVLGLSGVFISW